MNDGTPRLVVYWARWADARGGVGPFSKTCVARVEGGALPELVYLGATRPALASVSRKIEPLPFPQLEAGQRVMEVGAAAPRLLDAA